MSENQNPNYKAVNELASKLAKSEKYHGTGEGSQVKIGDFREILADLADAVAADPQILQALHRYGMDRKRERRAEENAKAKVAASESVKAKANKKAK